MFTLLSTCLLLVALPLAIERSNRRKNICSVSSKPTLPGNTQCDPPKPNLASALSPQRPYSSTAHSQRNVDGIDAYADRRYGSDGSGDQDTGKTRKPWDPPFPGSRTLERGKMGLRVLPPVHEASSRSDPIVSSSSRNPAVQPSMGKRIFPLSGGSKEVQESEPERSEARSSRATRGSSSVDLFHVSTPPSSTVGSETERAPSPTPPLPDPSIVLPPPRLSSKHPHDPAPILPPPPVRTDTSPSQRQPESQQHAPNASAQNPIFSLEPAQSSKTPNQRDPPPPQPYSEQPSLPESSQTQSAIQPQGSQDTPPPPPSSAKSALSAILSILRSIALIFSILLFLFLFAVLIAHLLASFIMYRTEARLGDIRTGLLKGGEMRMCLCAR